MLPGHTGKKSGILLWLPRSLGRFAGFTIIELMFVCVIMGVIMSALLATLQVGELASGIGLEKVDLESEVRMIEDWICQDARQAKIQELDKYNPTTNHMNFSLWEWDNATHSQSMNFTNNAYVEYTYDSSNLILSRKYQDEDQEVSYANFTNISQAPFYTSYTNPTDNSFSNSTLLNTRKLIVVIKKEKTVRNQDLNFTLVREIRIRNE